jgi:hypothetical protein
MNIQQLCDLILQLIEKLQTGYSDNGDNHVQTQNEIKKIITALKKLNTIETNTNKTNSDMNIMLTNLTEALANITSQKKQIEVMNGKLDMIFKILNKGEETNA